MICYFAAPGLQSLSELAREIGADTRSFDRELRGRITGLAWKKDLTTDPRAAYTARRSFFINGIRHEGGRDLAA